MRNARDLDEVPEDVRKQVEFIFAEDMQQVLDAALEPAADLHDRPTLSPPEAEGSPRAQA